MLLALAMSSDCPQAERVAARVEALRATGQRAPQYRLKIERVSDSMTITAFKPEGEALFERTLPASAACAELEEAAAVVVLAWEARLEPGALPVPTLEGKRDTAPTPSSPPRVREIRATAAGLGWLSLAPVAWGALVGAELKGTTFGVKLEVMLQGRRELSLGEGRASWSRVSAAVGPTVSFPLADRVDLSVATSLLAGPFWADGSGFAESFRVADWDLGFSADARLFLPSFWKMRFFVGLGGAVWVRRHEVKAGLPDSSRALPTLEAFPTMGLAFSS